MSKTLFYSGQFTFARWKVFTESNVQELKKKNIVRIFYFIFLLLLWKIHKDKFIWMSIRKQEFHKFSIFEKLPEYIKKKEDNF